MCLIALAHHVSPRWPLILAANRDELYARPTRAAHLWEDDPRIFGGRDLLAGGSWLALRRGGRFAAVTNVRGAGLKEGGPSRGALVAGFVRGGASPKSFLASIDRRAYAGFHLIVGDGETVMHCSSLDDSSASIEGMFAISNAPAGERWPKVELARDFLARAIERNDDAEKLAADLLQFLGTARGGPLESEVFVATEFYGTRSSTIIIVHPDGSALFKEKTYR